MKKIIILLGILVSISIVTVTSFVVMSVLSGSRDDNAVFQLQNWTNISIFEYKKIALDDNEKDGIRTIKIVYGPISGDVEKLIEKKLAGIRYRKNISSTNIVYEIDSMSVDVSGASVSIDHTNKILTIQGSGKGKK